MISRSCHCNSLSRPSVIDDHGLARSPSLLDLSERQSAAPKTSRASLCARPGSAGAGAGSATDVSSLRATRLTHMPVLEDPRQPRQVPDPRLESRDRSVQLRPSALSGTAGRTREQHCSVAVTQSSKLFRWSVAGGGYMDSLGSRDVEGWPYDMVVVAVNVASAVPLVVWLESSYVNKHCFLLFHRCRRLEGGCEQTGRCSSVRSCSRCCPCAHQPPGTSVASTLQRAGEKRHFDDACSPRQRPRPVCPPFFHPLTALSTSTMARGRLWIK